MGPTRLQFTQDKAHVGRVVDEVVRNPDVGIFEEQKFPPVVLSGRDALGELEDYVEAWQEELRHAPSHADPGNVAAALDAGPAVVDHRRVST